jgi:M6 family metalloprotease-like protein
MNATIFISIAFVMSFLGGNVPPVSGGESNFLGPQSTQARGEKRVLVVAVKFLDAQPGKSLDEIKRRAIVSLNAYVTDQSYGQISIKADFRGWVMLPDSLSHYKVSPYNFKVDKKRVRKLVEDTMSSIEGEVDFSRYDQLVIIPGVNTMPGQGYGMICYCANPGMLSGVSKRYVPKYEPLRTKGGKEFRGGVIVAAENAHLGMFAHDYIHTLGGIQDGKRLTPCLYDFERQSDASAGLPSFEHHAVYMGPWDIMSQHMIQQGQPCPGLSSFTKIRLGWITQDQALLVKPGETSHVFLSPLAEKGAKLVIKIPIDHDQYYLVENRQPVGYDKMLPDAGILVLKVNPDVQEGYGTVRIMNADPHAHNFSKATYALAAQDRNLFVDKKNHVAVIPLWMKGENLGVLVTTAEKSGSALQAAGAILQLMRGARRPEREKTLRLAVDAFETNDFDRSYRFASGMPGSN